MMRRSLTGWLVPALVVLAAVSAARADRIRTTAGIGYRGEIIGMDPSGLVIEGAAGPRTVPLADVEEIEVDGHPKLSQAEEEFDEGLRGGAGADQAFRDAERLYESLMRDRIPEWMQILIRSRLVRLYGRSGRIVQAVDAYLALAKAHPELVQGLSLPRPRRGADIENRALLTKVDEALERAEGQPYAKELQRLRVALVLEVGSPEQQLPLIRRALQSRKATTRRWARRKMLDLLLDMGRIEDAEEQLEKAEGEEGGAHLAYYRGRILAEKKKAVEAALAFMRVPVLYGPTDRELTAESLYRAGRALEQANWPTAEIRKVYAEAAEDYAGTPGAERARRALAVLEP
jgi:tetratricopeptide (TPR) repeat protein